MKDKISVTKKSNTKKPLGTLDLSSKSLPAIKSAKLNDEIELKVKVKVSSLRSPDMWEINEYGHSKDEVLARAEIVSIDSTGK